MLGRFLRETRSAHACAVETCIRPMYFSTCFANFIEKTFFYRARALFLSAQAWRLRISLKTRSAHACAVQTRFRPSLFGVFFEPFSLKCIGLLRFGAALLRLSHAWPFSARNAIRSRLCNPNTHSPHPFFHVFRWKVGFLLRPTPSFTRPSLAPPNFSQNAIRSRLCSPNLPPI